MARSNGITLSGGEIWRKKMRAAQAKVPHMMEAATDEAMRFVEGKAKELLDAEIYHDRPAHEEEPPDKSAAGSLYASFRRVVFGIGTATVYGELVNTSPHARFIEHGTDNEGTGSHFVPVAPGGQLAWMNAQTGEEVFAKGGVTVKGIKPVRFMERALSENKAEVIAIYKKHAAGLF